MKISYDAGVDALSITFRETAVITKHLGEGIAADYDSEGRLAGSKYSMLKSGSVVPKRCAALNWKASAAENKQRKLRCRSRKHPLR